MKKNKTKSIFCPSKNQRGIEKIKSQIHHLLEQALDVQQQHPRRHDNLQSLLDPGHQGAQSRDRNHWSQRGVVYAKHNN